MTDLLRHQRNHDIAPRGIRWRAGCRCGWEKVIDYSRCKSTDEAHAILESEFKAHIPPAELQTELLVDARPGPLTEDDEETIMGTFIMPEGVATKLIMHWESEGLRYGKTACGRTFPIAEIRTQDGRVFKP